MTARAARIKDSLGDMNDFGAVTKQHQEDLAELKGKHQAAQAKYEERSEELVNTIRICRGEIEMNREKIRKLNRDCEQIETQIGVNGTTLIECLAAVSAFTGKQKDWAQMYAPLVAVLTSE
jgi:chromosome segregation ATPase